MRAAAILICATLLLAGLPLAAAQLDYGDLADILDDGGPVGDQRVSVGMDGNRARIEITRDTRDGTDRLSVIGDARTSTLTIEERIAGSRNRADIRVQASHVVEYIDMDNDGMFTPGVDDVQGTYRVSRPRDSIASLEPLPDQGGHRIVLRTLLGNTGMLIMTATVGGEYSQGEGAPLTVDALDVAWSLDRYKARDANASIAVLATVAQRGSVAGLGTTDPFPWQQAATVNDVATAAHAKVVETDARARGDSRGETVAITLVATPYTGPAPAPDVTTPTPDVTPPDAGTTFDSYRSMARCAMLFRCY